jgi:hypothetical protein
LPNASNEKALARPSPAAGQSHEGYETVIPAWMRNPAPWKATWRLRKRSISVRANLKLAIPFDKLRTGLDAGFILPE